jgi:GxxExxY protein
MDVPDTIIAAHRRRAYAITESGPPMLHSPEKVSTMSHAFDPLSRRINLAALRVHRALGPGFLESVYHGALRLALKQEGLACENEAEVRIFYEGAEVGVHYLDLLVERQIVVELKAVQDLKAVHFAQVRSYLKATGLHVGLLYNFNAPTLEIRRVVYG